MEEGNKKIIMIKTEAEFDTILCGSCDFKGECISARDVHSREILCCSWYVFKVNGFINYVISNEPTT